MIVRLKSTVSGHPYLCGGKLYFVFGIEANDFRLLCDRGEPCLYDPSLFDVVDESQPTEWVRSYGDEGELYAYAPALNRQGFFEDFHDGVPEAVATFWRYVNSKMTSTAKP